MGDQNFNYDSIPLGFYDSITQTKKGMRSFWHHNKFSKIIECFKKDNGSILDIGCFSGTFLNLVKKDLFEQQVGIDILEKQIDFANENYGTDFRKFIFLKDFEKMNKHNFKISFDAVTCIEVIEHLTSEEINDLFQFAHHKMKTNGAFYLTTPNYSSNWPILEIILNLLSSVKYEEQHITKFSYLNFNKKIREVVKDFDSKFDIEFVTTINFLTPYVAIFSYKLANHISKLIKHHKWQNPFGSLLMIKLVKK